MPSDKEIEEALHDVADDKHYTPARYREKILADAYLSMKAERDALQLALSNSAETSASHYQDFLDMKSERDRIEVERDDYKYLFEHEQIASSRAEAERDKYKMIVDADIIALECFNDWWHLPNNDRTIENIEGSMVLCKNALALREKES